MKLLYILWAVLAIIAMSACSHYPTPYFTDKGGAAYATQVGGKWMHTINADGSMSFTGDNEVSLQHVMQTAAALGYSLFEYLEHVETLLTQRHLQGQITTRQFNTGMRQLEELRIAAGLKSQGIQSGRAPLGPIEFQ